MTFLHVDVLALCLLRVRCVLRCMGFPVGSPKRRAGGIAAASSGRERGKIDLARWITWLLDRETISQSNVQMVFISEEKGLQHIYSTDYSFTE